MYNFGAGRARLVPAGGGQIVELGVVQNASLELKVDLKELRGAYRFPIAIADGKGTASGKVSFAQMWPITLGTILGGTVTTGNQNVQAVIGEAVTIGATPFHGTLANGATMVAGSEVVTVVLPGYGPVFYTRGTPGAATLNNPTGGQYSINNSGVMTFTATEYNTGNPWAVNVTYLWAASGGPANQQTGVSLVQVGMNTALSFQLQLLGTGRNIYNNGAQEFIVQLNACLAPSLKFDFKLDDFTMMDLDFSAFIDQNGNLGNIYMLNP